MDIVIVSDSGEPELILKASELMNYWFGDMAKADRFSAYIDLVFRANDEAVLITSIRSLSLRWKMSKPSARNLLRLLKNHRLIDYERAKNRQIKITILIPDQEGEQHG